MSSSSSLQSPGETTQPDLKEPQDFIDDRLMKSLTSITAIINKIEKMEIPPTPKQLEESKIFIKKLNALPEDKTFTPIISELSRTISSTVGSRAVKLAKIVTLVSEFQLEYQIYLFHKLIENNRNPWKFNELQNAIKSRNNYPHLWKIISAYCATVTDIPDDIPETLESLRNPGRYKDKEEQKADYKNLLSSFITYQVLRLKNSPNFKNNAVITDTNEDSSIGSLPPGSSTPRYGLNDELLDDDSPTNNPSDNSNITNNNSAGTFNSQGSSQQNNPTISAKPASPNKPISHNSNQNFRTDSLSTSDRQDSPQNNSATSSRKHSSPKGNNTQSTTHQHKREVVQSDAKSTRYDSKNTNNQNPPADSSKTSYQEDSSANSPNSKKRLQKNRNAENTHARNEDTTNKFIELINDSKWIVSRIIQLPGLATRNIKESIKTLIDVKKERLPQAPNKEDFLSIVNNMKIIVLRGGTGAKDHLERSTLIDAKIEPHTPKFKIEYQLYLLHRLISITPSLSLHLDPLIKIINNQDGHGNQVDSAYIAKEVRRLEPKLLPQNANTNHSLPAGSPTFRPSNSANSNSNSSGSNPIPQPQNPSPSSTLSNSMFAVSTGATNSSNSSNSSNSNYPGWRLHTTDTNILLMMDSNSSSSASSITTPVPSPSVSHSSPPQNNSNSFSTNSNNSSASVIIDFSYEIVYQNPNGSRFEFSNEPMTHDELMTETTACIARLQQNKSLADSISNDDNNPPELIIASIPTKNALAETKLPNPHNLFLAPSNNSSYNAFNSNSSPQPMDVSNDMPTNSNNSNGSNTLGNNTLFRSAPNNSAGRSDPHDSSQQSNQTNSNQAVTYRKNQRNENLNDPNNIMNPDINPSLQRKKIKLPASPKLN